MQISSSTWGKNLSEALQIYKEHPFSSLLENWKYSIRDPASTKKAEQEHESRTPTLKDWAAQGLECLREQQPEDYHPDLFRTLSILSENFSYEQMTSLLKRVRDSFPVMPLESQKEAVATLTATLISSPIGVSEEKLATTVFEFLFNNVYKNDNSDQDLKDWVLYALALNASAFLPDQIRSVANTIQYKQKRYLRGEGLSGDSEVQTWVFKELLGQFEILNQFETMRRRVDFGERDLPFMFSAHSRKGGVGKTLILLVLALKLAQEGFKTCILDMDFQGPSFPFIFEFPKKLVQTLEDYLDPNKTISDAQDRMEELFGNPTNSSIKEFSNNLLVSHSCPLAVQRMNIYDAFAGGDVERISKLLRGLLVALRKEKGVQIVLIDNSPGYSTFSQLSCNLARIAQGMAVFITSADVQDVAGLQIEMDLLRQQAIETDSDRYFMWIINKLKEGKIRSLYEKPKDLMRLFRYHPALTSIARFPSLKIIERFLLSPSPKFIKPYPIEDLFRCSSHSSLPPLKELLGKNSLAEDKTIGEILREIRRGVEAKEV